MSPCDSDNHRFCECDGCNEKIRELEAELARLKSPVNRWWLDLVERREKAVARAEKAEKALEIAEAQVYRWSAGQRDTEQRLADSEASVAELEAEIVRWHRRYPKDVSEEAFRLLENETRERGE